MVVIPTFFNPNTTKYIPIENNTIFHGAPLITCFVCTACDLRANNTAYKQKDILFHLITNNIKITH